MPLRDESKMSSKQIPMLFFKVKQKHFYSWKPVRILIVSTALQLRLKHKKKGICRCHLRLSIPQKKSLKWTVKVWKHSIIKCLWTLPVLTQAFLSESLSLRNTSKDDDKTIQEKEIQISV